MTSVWRSRMFRRFLFVLVIWALTLVGFLHLGRNPVRSLIRIPESANLRLLSSKMAHFSSAAQHPPLDPRESVLFMEPDVDRFSEKSDDKIINRIQKTLPSLPILYWNKTKNQPKFYKNESCARFPSIYELEFNNIYWQTLVTSNGTFQLYGAYYDIRRFSKIGPAVRILGMINRIEPTVKTFCQFWFEDEKEPAFVKTLEYKYIWYRKWGNYKQGIYQPYLIACQIPAKFKGKVQKQVIEDYFTSSWNSHQGRPRRRLNPFKSPRHWEKQTKNRDGEQKCEKMAVEEGTRAISEGPDDLFYNVTSQTHTSAIDEHKDIFVAYIPASVSLVEKPCNNATNNLRVIYNHSADGRKKGFAVCVKGLDFLHEDLSVRLVEWIELLHLLGADKVFFYQLQVHPNISKVLNYYEAKGKVSVTPLTLPGGQPNLPGFQHLYLTKRVNYKRQNELIPYNDCLYKNLYTYEYVALLDIDEVIMPVKSNNWTDLMKVVLEKALKIKNETRASYNFRNVYFLDDLSHAHGWFKDIPKYMHMLQHVYRAVNYTKPNQYIKCFHNPERALTLHNHFPLACLGQSCTTYAVETEDAQLQHYRADCVRTLKKTCVEFRQNSVIDSTIWRHKKELIRRTTETLYELGFFKKVKLSGTVVPT